MAREKAVKKPSTIVCVECGKEKPLKDFLNCNSSIHITGKIPVCYDCLYEQVSNFKGLIDLNKLVSLLRKYDAPLHIKLLVAMMEKLKNKSNKQTYLRDIEKQSLKDYINSYKMYPQYENDTFRDSESVDNNGNIKASEIAVFDNWRKKAGEILLCNPDDIEENLFIDESEKPKKQKFVVTDEMRTLFGDGFKVDEYEKMQKKFDELSQSYVIQTSLHKESLATYVRFKVKEEMATAIGDVAQAEKWYKCASDASEKAKLTPKQLTKSDLQGGLNSIGDIFKAVEEAEDIIPILPQFKFKPNDAVDFLLWEYVNYERDLNNLPHVDYKEIYAFYDRKVDEYVKQHGDPYGIFTNDPTKTNRPSIEKFIQLPDDFETIGDTDGE